MVRRRSNDPLLLIILNESFPDGSALPQQAIEGNQICKDIVSRVALTSG